MTNITPNGRPITKSKSAGLDDSVVSSVTINFSFEISFWSVVEAGVSVVELEVEEEDELDDSASGSILFFS